jgi:hypothetical protein
MIPDAQVGNMHDQFNLNELNGGTGSDFRLYQNNVLLTPQVALGDLTEATFDGYTPLLANSDWIRRTDPDTGRAASLNPSIPLQIVTGTTDLPQVIYGWYVVTSTGLLATVNKFPQPVALNANGDAWMPDVKMLFNNSVQDQ